MVAFIGPFVLMVYWRGALAGNQEIADWNSTSITSYYFVLVVVSAFLMSHVEEPVAWEDVQKGELARYLLKPFSYYWIKFLEEFPSRVYQSVCGVVVITIFGIFFGLFLPHPQNLVQILLLVTLIILAFFITFTFKIILGMISLWIIDVGGLFQLSEAIIVIAAGYTIPLTLMPNFMSDIVKFTPFPYMIYYPVIGILGKLSANELGGILMIQIIWLMMLVFLYSVMWKKGIKKFTGVGQ